MKCRLPHRDVHGRRRDKDAFAGTGSSLIVSSVTSAAIYCSTPVTAPGPGSVKAGFENPKSASDRRRSRRNPRRLKPEKGHQFEIKKFVRQYRADPARPQYRGGQRSAPAGAH